MHDSIRNLLRGHDVRVRIAEEESCCIVEVNLLDVDDELTAFILVKLRVQSIQFSVCFRIAVAGTVLCIGTVDVGVPVLVQICLRIARSSRRDVGNQEVKLAVDTHFINDIVVNGFNLDINADLLSVSLNSLCVERELCTAVVNNEFEGQRFAVFIADSVAVRILPACLVKELVSALNIVFVRVLQLIEAIVQGRRNRSGAFLECALEQALMRASRTFLSPRI